MPAHARAVELLVEERTAARHLLSQLRHDFERVVAASVDSNADDEHDPEGSTIAYERSQLTALIDQAERRLTECDEALSRIEGGIYGRCETCGRPIDPLRLEARPTARTCVTCS